MNSSRMIAIYRGNHAYGLLAFSKSQLSQAAPLDFNVLVKCGDSSPEKLHKVKLSERKEYHMQHTMIGSHR